jgi:hypothetical protein
LGLKSLVKAKGQTMNNFRVVAAGGILLFLAAQISGQPSSPAVASPKGAPHEKCAYDGSGAALAEVIAESASERPGDMVVVYRVQGDWTCGYLTHKAGARSGWIPSAAIRLFNADPKPPLDAWLGTWRKDEEYITIVNAKTPGKVALESGRALHGSKHVAQGGETKGEAIPNGNHAHFVDDNLHICEVDVTLYGKYLLSEDNHFCGDLNVRFWGIWTRSKE